ncbi:hypothetical protein L581_2435 [Serratia fonticola AU-AP2C]|nr:hypothetical protein L581_2435 [Serratia fonticola AU-AP2C]
MPYASEIKQLGKKPIENESFLTNTENETELPVEVPSTSFTERLDEEIEADLAELRAHLQAIISGALPGFYEFQQAGYNLLYPKKVDIDALQARVNTMQIPALIQPQHTLLEQAANAFLDRFRRFRKESDLHNNALEFIKFRLEVNKAGWDEPQNRDYHQALKHGNRLSGYLSGTLDLMSLLNENVERQTPWETTRQANYDVLLNELLPVNADAHNNQYAAKTRGNLTGKQPDNIKFNAIVDSVTLDERIARETVSAEIERLSARLLSGITLTRNYAEKPDETGETSGIKRDIDFLCQVLQSVIPLVQYTGQQIQPETYQPLHQKEARTTLETVTHELGKAWNAVGQKMQGAKASVQTLSDKGNKNKHRIAHTVSGSIASDKNGDSHNINKAVFQVGIRLLDKIQQTTSDMHKAIQTSRPLQQTVSHYSELDEMLSGMPRNSILDAKLRAESGKWRQKAEESKEQLQQVLGTITTLPDESMKQRYLSALREELNAVTHPLASNNIIRDFDTQVKATVEGLSDIQKALGQALLGLSAHGQAGGKELDKHTESWLQQLKGIKDNLKTGITQATGQSINNFSRQGMLARWMAEWSEAEKQRYLGALSAEERAATEKHYDNVFFEVIQHYLPQLSKESDPQGERLLQRLRLEVGNAAQGTTLYPATMADILAGMKSREQAIRDWSERKLIRGAFLAVCLGGFKLLPNLAAFPLRLPIKFAITGAKVAWGAHKGRQGIRGGEGGISDEIAEYAKQSYKTAAIKIVLSLPPGLATTLGIASIVWDVYEGGLKGAGEKVAKHIIGEAPWRGLDTGTRTVAEAYATTLIEAAITEEKIISASHSSPLQPQTDVKPLSDEHDPDADRPHVRRKRAAVGIPPQAQRSEMVADNDNLSAENRPDDVPGRLSSLLQPQTDVKSLSDEHDPGINQPHKIRKRAAEWNINGRRITFPPPLDGEDRLFLNPKRNYAMFALKWANQNNTEVAGWVTNPDIKTHTQLNTKDWGVIDVRYNEEEGVYETSDNRVINDYITQLAKITILSEGGLDDELENLIIDNESVEYSEYIKRFNSTFSDENVKKIKTEKQDQEENRKKDERLRGEAKKAELNRYKEVVKKKHYDDSVEMYLKGRGGDIYSAEKSSRPSEIQIPHTLIKVSLISVINGDVPKDIVATLVKPDVISDDEWRDVISGKLYDEIKSETDSQDEELIRVEEFITKVEGVIKDIQDSEEYIKQWIRDNSNLEPDDTYTFHITHPLPDKFKGNEKLYENQIRKFKNRHPDKTKTVTIYDIVTGKVDYDLNPTRSTNVKVDMPENSEVFNVYSRRDEVISGYGKYLDEINTRHAKDIDNYFTLSNKLNGGEMNKTSAWFDKLKEHLDEVTYTETEIEVDFGLRVTGEVIGAVGDFLPLSPLKGFIFITGSQIGINLLQTENTSSPEEKEMYREAARKTAIYGAILSIPGIIGSKPVSKVGSFIKQGYRHTVNSNIPKVSKPVMDTPRGTQPTTTHSGAKSQHFWSDKEGSHIPVSKLREKFNAEAGMPGWLQPGEYLPRKFRIGKTDFLGKINGGEFYISLDNGVTWIKGNKIHLLAYRLQNSGGVNKISEEGQSTSQGPSQSTNPSTTVGIPPPPPPAPLLGNMPLPMKIGKPPVTSGPSTAPGAVTPQTMTIGPVKPKPLSGIPEPKVKELEALALSARGGSKKPADMSSKEERYYNSLVNYYEKDVNWKNVVNKGQGKYSEFYEAPPRPVSKSEEYHLRYEKKTSPKASTAPYIDKDGNVATPAGKVTDIHVKGELESYYKFRVSDDGKVFVVDNMYRNRDVQVTKPGRGNPLNMNELQGEFMKENGGLLKNVEFITQENIANADTHNLMRLAFGENVLRASANKPIVLKPEGPTKDAFHAMLTTPNIQPTARMLSTYPEFGKQIKEIRIQSVTRITSTLESSDMPGQARSRIARDTSSSNQVEETFVLRITLVLESNEQVELSEDTNNSISTSDVNSDANMVRLPLVTPVNLDTETFNQHTFEQALAVFISNNSASDQVDTSYKPYIAVFKTMPASNEISLKQVEVLERLATDGDLQAQAKYHYAVLAYLSGENGIKLPIDANAIRKQIEQDREKAKYEYDWKVREKKERQRRLGYAKLNRLDAEYVRRENREKLNFLDEVVAYLESEVAARDSLMNQWRHTMSVTSLRLDLWSKFFSKKQIL